MKWVCTNCGNHFENEEAGARCPECLRRNGIILVEKEKAPRAGESSGPEKNARRLALIMAISAAVIAVGVAMIVLLLVSPDPRSSSRYASPPDDFATAAARAKEAGGLDLPAGENPFSAPAAVGDLVKKWGGSADAVFARLEDTAKPLVNPGLPQALATALLKDQPPRATPLEWALLGHAMAVRLNQPVAISLLRVPVGTSAHPWGLGLYATALFGNGFEKPATRILPFGTDAGTPEARQLSGPEVLAVVLSQTALGRVSCVQRPMELILPRDKPRTASDDDARYASQRLQAAAHLAPDLPVVKAAAVWGHVCLGMHRKARGLAEALVSEFEMLQQKATGGSFSHEQDLRRLAGFSALIQFVDGAPTGAVEALEKADADFAPLAIPVAISAQDTGKLQAALAGLPASDLPEIRYLRLVGTLMIRDKAAMQAALPDARALSGAYPGAKWALQMLFTLLMATDGFDEARALIPTIISGAPNAGELTTDLRNLIDQAEARAKSAAEAEKAAAESAATTGTPPKLEDPMK
jgi:DNA-directed RNA polymerase subunit RPC12/RpoP